MADACCHCKDALVALAASDAVLTDCMKFTHAVADAFLHGKTAGLRAMSDKSLRDIDTRAQFALDAIRKLAKEIDLG